ncbi:hypothetical protein MSG28_000619 [Choristoneura fumiferana]|uniref:Uncharacterized protein n=1 Tax=Choristoneura fumiferana TaxID=7141 RepID=A0ACC0K1J6_CHOFU|nr:hypothetical protein MSG28_000619 [Choristoneura fumiferana]
MMFPGANTSYLYIINEGEDRRQVCLRFLLNTLDVTVVQNTLFNSTQVYPPYRLTIVEKILLVFLPSEMKNIAMLICTKFIKRNNRETALIRLEKKFLGISFLMILTLVFTLLKRINVGYKNQGQINTLCVIRHAKSIQHANGRQYATVLFKKICCL